MAITIRSERVTTADASELNAYLALPEQRTGARVLVLQEIFGVNDYVKSAADRLTGKVAVRAWQLTSDFLARTLGPR